MTKNEETTQDPNRRNAPAAIEIETDRPGETLEGIVRRIQQELERQPKRIIAVHCRNESYADGISAKLKPKELAQVQYSWPTRTSLAYPK